MGVGGGRRAPEYGIHEGAPPEPQAPVAGGDRRLRPSMDSGLSCPHAVEQPDIAPEKVSASATGQVAPSTKHSRQAPAPDRLSQSKMK
eukprot:scaffold13230_cov98-Isochrysis_galbana.AAC.1